MRLKVGQFANFRTAFQLHALREVAAGDGMAGIGQDFQGIE